MSLFAQIQQNPRLQIGLAIVAAIVGGVLIQDWAVANEQSKQKAQRKAREVARLQADADPALWQGRSKQAREERDLALQTVWTASSQGLAQAQFQQWLTRQLNQASARNLRMTGGSEIAPTSSAIGSDDPALAKTLVLVPMRLNLNFEPAGGTVETLLAALETQGKRVTIESINLRRLPVPVVDMQVVGYAVIDQALAEKMALIERKESESATSADLTNPAQANSAASSAAARKGQLEQSFGLQAPNQPASDNAGLRMPQQPARGNP